MTIYDLSGGDEHIREIAEESGVEWEVCHTSEDTEAIVLDVGDDRIGVTIDSWYNESADSPWAAWGAFARGYGIRHGASRGEAIERLCDLICDPKPKPRRTDMRITMQELRICEIQRDVTRQHPQWVHDRLGTTSEVELQAALDAMDVDDWYDDAGNHRGPDDIGLSMYRD
jgi:hypothetical protein